ncbi:hypothetical protein MNBD_GAMMA09-1433 [hydrothermal vent metagenome]|uniref:DUF4136 domain-containing protein n=1 Tax=hydrothermal vent metagenome TaxID=652676 RepID=A0A3B0XUV5_9ZZZZ
MAIIKRFVIIYLSIIISFLVSGVVHAQDIKEKNPELARSSVVVVGKAGFKFAKNTEFTWVKDHADISGAFKKADFPVQTLLDDGIMQALQARGYKFNPSNKSSLQIHYHVSLESEMDDTALAIRYGLAPGLNANSEASKKYERGTLVVDLIDPALLKVVWRGAIGVFTGIEKTDQGRKERVNVLMQELFASVPYVQKAPVNGH